MLRIGERTINNAMQAIFMSLLHRFHSLLYIHCRPMNKKRGYSSTAQVSSCLLRYDSRLPLRYQAGLFTIQASLFYTIQGGSLLQYKPSLLCGTRRVSFTIPGEALTVLIGSFTMPTVSVPAPCPIPRSCRIRVHVGRTADLFTKAVRQ